MTSSAEITNVSEHPSALTFSQTVDRLKRAIEGAQMSIFATIDHAGAARSAGLSMPPTTVLLYGNPRGGTPMMLASPAAALDLPLRVLVREDAHGHSFVLFHPIVATLAKAGVPDLLAARLEPAQQVLVNVLKP